MPAFLILVAGLQGIFPVWHSPTGFFSCPSNQFPSLLTCSACLPCQCAVSLCLCLWLSLPIRATLHFASCFFSSFFFALVSFFCRNAYTQCQLELKQHVERLPAAPPFPLPSFLYSFRRARFLSYQFAPGLAGRKKHRDVATVERLIRRRAGDAVVRERERERERDVIRAHSQITRSCSRHTQVKHTHTQT